MKTLATIATTAIDTIGRHWALFFLLGAGAAVYTILQHALGFAAAVGGAR